MHSLVRNCAINVIKAIFQLVMSSTEEVFFSAAAWNRTEDKDPQTFSVDLLLAYLDILDGESYIVWQFSFFML